MNPANMASVASLKIQRKVGIVLSIFLALTSVINFIIGINNLQETVITSITNSAVLHTAIYSILILITGIIITNFFRILQVIIIFMSGIVTILLTPPESMTGILILLFGLALFYQYGYLARHFFLKLSIMVMVLAFTIIANIILIQGLKLPFGIPSILFSLTTFYLFWMVFREEINIYLIRTNQLNRKLNQAVSENTQLGLITADQAVLIEEKNRILEENLKEKTEIEKELRRTLTLKEILLQEVHHRVKNNLTVINSLLNLQHTDENSSVINGFIESNSNRLYAMAAVHEAVYQSDTYESVKLGNYFSDITGNLVEIYSKNGELEIDINSEDIEITTDIAVPLGIIINECVSNSIVYGFNNNFTDRKIIISVKKNKINDIELIIADNGKRFSDNDYTKDKDTSFSLWLIKFLAEEQLQGAFILDYKHGNRWTIHFPSQELKSVAT